MASAGAAIWLQGIKTFFMESSTVIARAQQQRNATAAQFDSLEFIVRRLEEYERTLSVLTTRIEESYIQEITLFGLYLNRLPGIFERATMSLRENCKRIREGYGLV